MLLDRQFSLNCLSEKAHGSKCLIYGNVYEKYDPTFPENPYWVFLGHPV